MPMDNELQSEMEALRQENAWLKKELEHERQRSLNFAREAFLSDLAGDNRISPEEFQASCAQFGVDMPSDRFAVMTIQILSDEPFQVGGEVPDNQENLRYVRFLIRNVLEDSIGEKNRCHVMVVQGRLTAILNLIEPDETALVSIAEAVDRAGQLFEDHYDTVVIFSISSAHQDYTSIPAAYDEAKALQDYRAMAGDESRVLRYDHQTESHLVKERVEHFEFEHALGNQIRSGDYEAARTLVHRMLDAEFGHARPTVQVYMIRAYGIINDILHVFDSLEDEFSPEFLVELQAGPRIVSAGSLQEISNEVDDIFDAIIARQQEQEQEPPWVQRAMDYMDENITDQNLSVAIVADAVNINPVYLSRMLKKYRNIRPLEYLHQKRIAMAKELLSRGVTVKDTRAQVGYTSALTMNRAFRKYEDTTPGAFYRSPKGHL
mgnify:CR=1 FL=1